MTGIVTPAKTEIYLQSLPFWQAQITQAINQALQLNFDILPENSNQQRVNQILKAAEQSGTYQLNSSFKPVQNLGLMPLKAIAQVNKTYIIAEHESGLWLIEQHIAEERVLYEKLQDQWQLVNLEKPII